MAEEMVTIVSASPVIVEREGQLYVKITLDYAVLLAPIGDGRQFASRVIDMIVLPAISERPLDPKVLVVDLASPND